MGGEFWRYLNAVVNRFVGNRPGVSRNSLHEQNPFRLMSSYVRLHRAYRAGRKADESYHWVSHCYSLKKGVFYVFYCIMFVYNISTLLL